MAVAGHGRRDVQRQLVRLRRVGAMSGSCSNTPRFAPAAKSLVLVLPVPTYSTAHPLRQCVFMQSAMTATTNARYVCVVCVLCVCVCVCMLCVCEFGRDVVLLWCVGVFVSFVSLASSCRR